MSVRLGWVLTALACWGLLVSTRGAMADDATIRVLCYNIHYGQGNDHRYDIERLAKVMAAARPDVVALQEVDVGVARSGRVHQARRLGELTGMAVRFGPTQHYQGGLYGNAILSKLPIEDVLIVPLPYAEASEQRVTYPRGAIAVTVRVGERSVRVISTHFQHNLASDRLAQAKAINRRFGNEKDIPTILAGDLNALPDSPPLEVLRKHWTVVGNAPWQPTAPATKPSSRIDYILYRPAAQFQVVEESVVPETMASDHRPVFAELKIRATQ